MNPRPDKIFIYHITDVTNLPDVLAEGRLLSDSLMAKKNPTRIGYDHIKERRLKEIRVPCCSGRFVGEFVPFYFCPRSPMLFTINMGNTGRPVGSQSNILHLVSTVAVGIGLGRPWAISDGNAGAFHSSFEADITALGRLDWRAIHAKDWRGKTHQKSAEFLVADSFPWEGIQSIVCHNAGVEAQVKDLIKSEHHRPMVVVDKDWYY